MDKRELAHLMLILACATPAAAALLYATLRSAARAAGDGVIERRAKRNLILLALAGPANALAWFALNVWMDRQGPGAVFGMVIAALVFAGAGLATGLFTRGPRNRH